ncbi:hypothetical protein EZV73_02965 [Acidaminobacter sp. JC074]|uniref:hypothetical protein n=1 Tax=Acidaminobacter sp. JC074 TaxID=2530199 RepID=UPI001F10819B|nr:hypothetical protein [Acidaminobacter sp. JC074]MCH4886509.1 hypothetical protein [Acidaminobacter sp. JC074]
MKAKLLILMVVCLLFLGCEELDEIKGVIDEVEEVYTENKDEIDKVIEVVKESGADLENLDTEDLESILDRVSNAIEEDIDTQVIVDNLDGLLSNLSGDDLAGFGEYKATDFVSRNEVSASDGYVTEYYSSASFEKVVAYYKTLLENTEDYDITEYPGAADIKGTLGGVFVWFIIQEEDEETSYVVYQYENSGQAGNPASNAEEGGLTGEELKASIDDYVDVTFGDEIMIRHEIGQLDFEEWKEEWGNAYPKNLTVTIKGGGMDHDPPNTKEHNDGEIHYTFENKCYFKGRDYLIENTYKGAITRVTKILYNHEADVTTIIGQDGYIMSEHGDNAPIRLLDFSIFEELENDNETYKWLSEDGLLETIDEYGYREYIETKNGERVFLGHKYYRSGQTYSKMSLTYSLDKRIITDYKESGTTLEYCDHFMEGKILPYITSWKVTSIDIHSKIDDKLLDKDNYKGDYVQVEEND